MSMFGKDVLKILRVIFDFITRVNVKFYIRFTNTMTHVFIFFMWQTYGRYEEYHATYVPRYFGDTLYTAQNCSIWQLVQCYCVNSLQSKHRNLCFPLHSYPYYAVNMVKQLIFWNNVHVWQLYLCTVKWNEQWVSFSIPLYFWTSNMSEITIMKTPIRWRD